MPTGFGRQGIDHGGIDLGTGRRRSGLAYYQHLGRDDYYARGGEPPGRWAGEAAERLSLCGPVTQAEFSAPLNGHDPKTGDRLVRHGGPARDHTAGWDMTFSAPKSVSVLWALSDEPERRVVEHAHRSAVLAATGYLERNAAWARRGKGGAVREPTAGPLMAQFDHDTSREVDAQLHTRCFVFNLGRGATAAGGRSSARSSTRRRRLPAPYTAASSPARCSGRAIGSKP